MELYKVGIWMQKCSLTTSANNREVSVIPVNLLDGLPPAGTSHVERNCPHISVTELNAGELRNEACTEEAVFYSIILVIITLQN